MAFFPMFSTFFFEPFLVGKVMKENYIRKVRKSEKRKVKNIRKSYLVANFPLILTNLKVSTMSIVIENGHPLSNFSFLNVHIHTTTK